MYFHQRGNCHIGKLGDSWLWPEYYSGDLSSRVCAAIPYLGFRPAHGRTGGRAIRVRPYSTQGICPGRAIFDRILTNKVVLELPIPGRVLF